MLLIDLKPIQKRFLGDFINGVIRGLLFDVEGGEYYLE